MSTRFATPTEIKHWNHYIATNPDGGNILQGKEFIDQKTTSGWQPRYIFVNERAMVAIEKKIPILGKLWYMPKGPSTTSAQDLASLLQELKSFARSQGIFTIKIEPELDYQTELSGLDLIPTSPVQLNYATVLVDLSGSFEDILARFHQNGRHAIRRAQRDGVTVEAVPATDENCKTMYQLFLETAAGAGFVVRPAEYYKAFYRAYESTNSGQLFFAYYDGKVVAGAFAMVLGQKSMYKDGASIRERTAYGASHLLQWHVMQWAKQNGSLSHDLAGVPPIKDLKNPTHPFSGLARFKTSFNKQATQYVGAFEVPVVAWKAQLWHKFVEKIVRRLYLKRHKQSYY